MCQCSATVILITATLKKETNPTRGYPRPWPDPERGPKPAPKSMHWKS